VTWAERFRALRVDVTPLRTSRDFRLLWAGGTIFYLTGMVSYVAIPFQIYRLTGSNFAVGAIGFVELVPLIVFGLYGGALADHVDRRKLLIACGLGQAVLIAALAVNAFSSDPRLWLIFVMAGLLTATSAMQRPSREALMPRTVRHDQLTAAQALISFGMQVGVLVGPAVGGLLIAYVGLRWCFIVDVVGLCVATAMYAAMGHYAHRAETTPPSLAGIKAGLDYALKRRDLLGTYFVDIAAMMLALPVVLFPALAKDVFEAPQYLGLLYSAETVGALLMTAFSGWTSRVHLHGRAIVIAAAAYGVTIALAGIAPSIGVAAVFLALSGAADMISGIFRGTVWNQTIPESMRGRLAGIEMLSYSLGPTAGQIRAGVVADAWTVRGSIASGGVACVVGVALTAAWLRGFWTYDDRTDEHALAERDVRQAAGE
jgi:MFS family permease